MDLTDTMLPNSAAAAPSHALRISTSDEETLLVLLKSNDASMLNCLDLDAADILEESTPTTDKATTILRAMELRTLLDYNS